MRSAEDWADEVWRLEWGDKDILIEAITKIQREAALEMRFAAELTYDLMMQLPSGENLDAETLIDAISHIPLPGDE